MLTNIMNLVIMMICILLSIAFFTLMERKYISFSQNRKGPNKTAFGGLIQPISDAIKLLSKEMNLNQKSNFSIFMASPAANLVCSLAPWLIFPFSFEFNFMKMSVFFMMSCMALNMMSLIMMSWSSNSNYSFIGMMRTISQLVSYEINLILVLISMINLTNQMNFNLMWMSQQFCPLFIAVLPISILWLIIILAETNRTPFDFSEGESELVSGFNIEYASSSFIFLFLSEYASILLMSMITTLMFTSLSPTNMKFYLMYGFFCFFFVWARVTMPRFRYDKLMKFNWTQVLPLMTYMMLWSFMYKMYCTMKS